MMIYAVAARRFATLARQEILYSSLNHNLPSVTDVDAGRQWGGIVDGLAAEVVGG
jgi:hypothetical protein